MRVYECKGYQPSIIVFLREIEKWLNGKVPVIYKAHQAESGFQGSDFYFTFWACGKFDPDGLKLLEQASKKTKKYAILWADGAGIENLAKKIKAPPGIWKILNEHCFNSPLENFNTP